MPEIKIRKGSEMDTGIPTATKTNNWLEAFMVGVTGTFDALSSYVAGEEAGEQAAFRGRQAERQIGQIERDVATGAERLTRAGQQFTGAQRAAVAKSGVALSGSAEQAITESDRQFALEVAAFKNRGALDIIEKQAEADLAKVEERGARTLGRLGATRSLLQGVSRANRVRMGV
jgi:hypothetical protein